jgi:DHA1 family inner membrane transport protein
MVSPMTSTLIGEHFALEKRASAIGWLIAGGSLVYVVGAPIIALIAAQGGWRLPLLEFVIPVSLASFLLALVSLPSSSHSHPCTARKETYLQSYKMILLNRSAAACLVGDVLRSAAFVAVLLYAASFVRQRFLASLNFASVVILGGALCYTLGSLASGRLVNRIGRKPSAVLTAVLAGAFTMVFMRMPNLWLSLALIFAASWFFGMLTSAANCLTLEQVPKFRGTMMSMDSASVNLGSALGAAVGGLALIRFGYEGLGSILGVLSIAAAFVFYFLATDPTRQKN